MPSLLMGQRGLQIADHLLRLDRLLFVFQGGLRGRNLTAVSERVEVSSAVCDHLFKVIVPKQLVGVQQIMRVVYRTCLRFVHVVRHVLILATWELQVG